MIKPRRIGHATLETPDLERQLAYWTEVAGLVLAERDNNRAFLATRTGLLAVALERADRARCTRISFEAAIGQLGGTAITLPTAESQIARGETLEDTARVASRYVDAIIFRTHGDDRLRAFARAATVPVINGLSDGGHPVQVLADLFTVEEKLGAVAGKTLAFVGDCGSNMALSFCEAAPIFGYQLRLAAPKGYRPPAAALRGATVTSDPDEAVAGAQVVITDVFVSMGQEKEAAARMKALAGYQVNAALLAKADPKAVVLHCLPAHRDAEISADVLDGPQSAIFDEAENRLHVQKALLEHLVLRG